MTLLDEWDAPESAVITGGRAWVMSGVVLGLAVAAGAYVAHWADWSGLRQSREALARAEARADALRLAAARAPAPAVFAPLPLADLVIRLTRLAEDSGLHLRTFERAPAARSKGTAGQAGDGAAQGTSFHVLLVGDFPAMRRWLNGLPRLPALVVPQVLDARHETDAAVLEANLQLFPDLPGAGDPATDAAARDATPRIDPFAATNVAAPIAPVTNRWQLAGVLRGTRHGVALFEQDGETRVLATGHALEAANLMALDARGALLAQAGGDRQRMRLREAGAP